MLKHLVCPAALIVIIAVTGCSSLDNTTKSLGQKNTSGQGTVVLTKATVADPQTGSYTPELFSLFVHGEFMNILKDANLLRYSKTSAPMWYNKENVTVTETLVISIANKDNLADTVKQVKELLETKQKLAGQTTVQTR